MSSDLSYFCLMYPPTPTHHVSLVLLRGSVRFMAGVRLLETVWKLNECEVLVYQEEDTSGPPCPHVSPLSSCCQSEDGT